MNFIFEAEIICNHGDKFAVGRLAPIVLNGVSEVGIEGVNISSVPSYFDCMANRPLYSGGGGGVFFRNGGVKYLCNRCV